MPYIWEDGVYKLTTGGLFRIGRKDTMKFWHYVCGSCGLAWKQTSDIETAPNVRATSCPRCGSLRSRADEVKQTEESTG